MKEKHHLSSGFASNGNGSVGSLFDLSVYLVMRESGRRTQQTMHTVCISLGREVVEKLMVPSKENATIRLLATSLAPTLQMSADRSILCKHTLLSHK